MTNIQNNIPTNGNGHQQPAPVSRYGGFQEQQVTIKDYIRIIFKGRYIILFSFLFVMLFTIYFTFTTEPVYQATAKIMIEEEGGMGESLFDISSMMKKETMINNQVEILKSRTLAEEVIRKLKDEPYANQLRSLGNYPDGVEPKRDILAEAKKWVKAILIPGEEMEDPTEEETFNQLVKSLRENIAVNPIRNTDMIEIKVSAFSAWEAATVTNTISSVYDTTNQRQSREEVQQVREFIEQQRQLYSKDLKDSEEALKDYQEKAKVVALDHETEELVRKTAEFETLYNSAKTDFEAAQKRLDYLEKELASNNKDFDIESISSAPYLAELRMAISEKEGRIATLKASMIEVGEDPENHDDIKLLQKQRDALQKNFAEEVAKYAAAGFVDPAEISSNLVTSRIEVESELQALEPRVRELKKILAKYNNQLESLPNKSLKLARLTRDAQVNEKIYMMLQEKYQESRISEVGQLGNVRLIDKANPPEDPIKPKKKLNLILGFLLGLGLGVGIAFVRDYFDNSVNTMEDVEALNVPLLATIPYIKPEQGNGIINKISNSNAPDAATINERLITHVKPKSPISESYRTLRTNISFSTTAAKRQVFMITSSGPKEGKSTTISNLAITFAQMGTPTLLMDGDLRRPMVHKLFALDKQPGLTNVLVGRESLDDAIQTVDGLPNLHILPCGILPPNPAELLGSEQMRDLMKELRKRFGMIFIDAPPIIAVTDPAIIASMVDGALLCIRSAQSKRDAVQHALDQLRRVESPLTGAILNDIQAQNVYGSYYYYNYYHYYYGPDGEKKRKKSKRKKRRSKSL